MDASVNRSENEPPRGGTIPALPRRILRRKLLAMLLGTLAGIPVASLIRHYMYPWYSGTHHLAAGALAGAVIGGLLPGRTLGQLGWGIVWGTGGGTFLGFMLSSGKDELGLHGAVFGFILGFVLGIVGELTSSPPNAENHGQPPP
jgi:peptidoglycan/LPS O-acetylase OafA/YrhL